MSVHSYNPKNSLNNFLNPPHSSEDQDEYKEYAFSIDMFDEPLYAVDATNCGVFASFFPEFSSGYSPHLS